MVLSSERTVMCSHADGTGREGKKRARRLRTNSTDSEKLLWQQLRAHRLNGFGFRRQHPIGPYIVDFVCFPARLVVEVDGGQHYAPAGLSRDARRDAYLVSKGLRVLRFSNLDVIQNLPGVLDTLLDAVSNVTGDNEKHALRLVGEARDEGQPDAPTPEKQMTDGEP